MEKNDIWIENYYIDASMIAPSQEATLTSICNFLQLIAGHHAEHHNLGFEGMAKNNQAWVLNKLRVEMSSFPKWRSTITVHTWVHLMKGPFSYRNFEIYHQGQLIGSASTLWVALNTTTHRPARVKVVTLPIINDKLPPSGIASKIKIPTDLELLRTENHTVVYSDLDVLYHVNNVKYIEWILNSYGVSERKLAPKFLEVNYLQETLADDIVEIKTFQGNDFFYHQLIKKATQKPVLSAKIDWK